MPFEEESLAMTHKQRADLIRQAVKNAPNDPYGIFQFRLALFDAIQGCPGLASQIGDFIAPPGSKNQPKWDIALLLADVIEFDSAQLSDTKSMLELLKL